MAIYIGIDPGSHTGIAVWDTKARAFVMVGTMLIHEALEVVANAAKGNDVRVIFEDARQRKYLPRERNASEMRGKLMGAGSIKRDSAIWEEFLVAKGIPFVAQGPRAGLTKWTPEQFKRITGWTSVTSNHARDAALLVYGK